METLAMIESKIERNVEEQQQVDWLTCISGIQFERELVYFCDKSLVDTSPNRFRLSGDFSRKFPVGYFYSITGMNPLNKVQDRVRNALINAQLEDDLKKSFSSFPSYKIYKNFSYFQNRPHFERGFTVFLPFNDGQLHDYQKSDSIIHNLAEKYEQAAYFKCLVRKDGGVSQVLVLLEDYHREVEESLVVIERLSYHPAFHYGENASIYRSLVDATAELAKCQHISVVKDFLDIVKNIGTTTHLHSQHYPIIAMETTGSVNCEIQCKSLCDMVGARHIKSMPDFLKPLKSQFDRLPQILKGAFYHIANYMTAIIAAESAKNSPVVLERYWPCTAAKTILSEVGPMGVSSLPPKSHCAYEWPSDLLHPSVIIFVNNRSKTNQHYKLSNKMLLEMYKRMKNTNWIEISKQRSPGAISMAIVDKLKSRKMTDVMMVDNALCPANSAQPSW